MSSYDEMTPQQRAALLTYQLLNGRQYSTAEIAETFNMTWHGAARLVNNISAYIPIAVNSTGRWVRFDNY
jgi:hypothetical protein